MHITSFFPFLFFYKKELSLIPKLSISQIGRFLVAIYISAPLRFDKRNFSYLLIPQVLLQRIGLIFQYI